MHTEDLIIGLGTHHAGDSAGWQVAARVEQLLTRAPLPHVRCYTIRDPSRLLECAGAHRRWWIIDAIRGGSSPGVILRLEWPDQRIAESTTCSSHGLGLTEVLHLTDRLGTLPRSVVVYGIESGNAEPSPETDRAVQAAIDETACRVVAEVSAAEPIGT